VVGVEGVEAEVERDSHLIWGFFRLYIECILVLGIPDVATLYHC
jgi:hypothetical protein